MPLRSPIMSSKHLKKTQKNHKPLKALHLKEAMRKFIKSTKESSKNFDKENCTSNDCRLEDVSRQLSLETCLKVLWSLFLWKWNFSEIIKFFADFFVETLYDGSLSDFFIGEQIKF